MSKKSELDNFFDSLIDDDFPAAIQKVNSYLYEILENQQNKSGGGRVTKDIMSVFKKCHDYISLRLVKAHRECVAAEVKLKTMVTDSKAYEALMERKSGASDIFIERPEVTFAKRKNMAKDSGYMVLVKPKEGEEDLENIKEELKKAVKNEADFPLLTDVITTKTGRLILKVPNKASSDKLSDYMNNWGDRVKITQANRRRCRVLLLSLEQDITKEDVFKSVNGVLQEADIKTQGEIELVKKYATRTGKMNWILDVDLDSFAYLVNRKRLCINCERYRVVQHIQIQRCFKCQTFGHLSNFCQNDQKCSKCAGNHNFRDCTSENLHCVNCMEDADLDAEHAADSFDCPSFKVYRDSLLKAQRL